MLALVRAPAAINDGDTLSAHDKADVGDFPSVFKVGNFMNPLMDKDTGSHLFEGQSFGPESWNLA